MRPVPGFILLKLYQPWSICMGKELFTGNMESQDRNAFDYAQGMFFMKCKWNTDFVGS